MGAEARRSGKWMLTDGLRVGLMVRAVPRAYVGMDAMG